MANKALFGSTGTAPEADTTNRAGGKAYRLPAKHALAQLATTGTLSDQYYSKAQDQLKVVLGLCDDITVTPKFIGQVALYAREKGYMKDMPALLCAKLNSHGVAGQAILRQVFPRVIRGGKMLRNYVQIMRSGVVGRKNLSSSFNKKMLRRWFDSRRDDALFRDSVGNSPTLVDIMKLARPKPQTDARRALGDYLMGKESLKAEHLPQVIKDYEAFKAALKNGEQCDIPKGVEFRMITGLEGFTEDHWKQVALDGPWQQTRMNLASYQEHGVFKDKTAVEAIVKKLVDREAIERAKVFPYHLLVAYMVATGGVSRYGHKGAATLPHAITEALQDALDIAIDSTPTFNVGEVVIACDTSGSMHSPVTGNRGRGQTSVVRMVDVAALMGAQVFRKNPGSTLWGFNDVLDEYRLNPRDSVMTIAEKLTSNSGGTNYSLAMQAIVDRKMRPDLVIYFGDMQSWLDTPGCAGTDYSPGMYSYYGNRGTTSKATGTQALWQQYRKTNPKAKIVFVNLAAYEDTQYSEDGQGMNVGGWSQAVFDQIRRFVDGDTSPEAWVREIEKIDLSQPEA
jgi:60 kDa SS-A/Ro ribonucleoprotein